MGSTTVLRVHLASARRWHLAALVLAVAAVVAGCGGTKTVTVERTVTQTRTVTTTRTTTATATGTTPGGLAAAPCKGSDLQGVFAIVTGSAGAGQIQYSLKLTNTASSACVVSGVPSVQLLDAHGAPLPTHATAAQPGSTAAQIVLEQGDSATADARFSPDVPGTGEQQSGPCEPAATTLRVTAPGGGYVDALVRPSTAVCQHGTMSLSAFSAAR